VMFIATYLSFLLKYYFSAAQRLALLAGGREKQLTQRKKSSLRFGLFLGAYRQVRCTFCWAVLG